MMLTNFSGIASSQFLHIIHAHIASLPKKWKQLYEKPMLFRIGFMNPQYYLYNFRNILYLYCLFWKEKNKIISNLHTVLVRMSRWSFERESEKASKSIFGKLGTLEGHVAWLYTLAASTVFGLNSWTYTNPPPFHDPNYLPATLMCDKDRISCEWLFWYELLFFN